MHLLSLSPANPVAIRISSGTSSWFMVKSFCLFFLFPSCLWRWSVEGQSGSTRQIPLQITINRFAIWIDMFWSLEISSPSCAWWKVNSPLSTGFMNKIFHPNIDEAWVHSSTPAHIKIQSVWHQGKWLCWAVVMILPCLCVSAGQEPSV